MIAIVAGCGSNVASIQYALNRMGKTSIITSCPNTIKRASYVIIPGVSTAQRALDQLKKSQLIDVILSLQQPVLGICSGMQILFQWCCEGEIPGLGIFPEKVNKLFSSIHLPLPHMGWNTLAIQSKTCPLLEGINDNDYVYFVHSFAAPIGEYTAASSEYGVEFSAVVVEKNFYGTQFHPERSGKVGEKILKNFLQCGDKR